MAEASRILRVTHDTIYGYDKPVQRSSHQFRLRPVIDAHQEVLAHRLDITPCHARRGFEDVFGNWTTNAELEQPYTELKLSMTSRVRIRAPRPLSSPTRRTSIPLVWMPWQRQMMTPYLLPVELPESQLRELSDYGMSFVERQDYNLVATLTDLNATIKRDFAYVTGSTNLETTPYEVFKKKRGVCQDFANLFICIARLLAVPARYRVGYIYTGGNYDNKQQADASHAWAEVYLPWLGWHGFDPTNGTIAGLDHIRVAAGRNCRDATPTAGTIHEGGGLETLSVNVHVEEEPPSTSSPG